MLPRFWNVVSLLTGILIFLLVLLLIHPFDWLNQGLDYLFGAPPKWAQVQNLFRDRHLQEVTRGENPQESFAILSEYWRQFPDRKRVVFIGNSQMMSVSLAKGEERLSTPEKAWVDIIATRAQSEQPPVSVYRLSTPGMSYMEALYYLEYFLSYPELKPDLLVLQVNYQAFWQAGIRPGMQQLLSDSSFRKIIEEHHSQNHSHSADFRTAITQWNQRSTTSTKETEAEQPAGSVLEAETRELLDQWPQFRNRHHQKEEALDFLYRCRLYFLRLKPSTARSISSVRLEKSQSAFETLLRKCQQNQVQVLLFDAPLNPNVQLYGKPSDREQYEEYLERITDKFSLPVHRFHDSVPSEEWGRWFNGPDPLHLSRAGNLRMADQIYPFMKECLE